MCNKGWVVEEQREFGGFRWHRSCRRAWYLCIEERDKQTTKNIRTRTQHGGGRYPVGIRIETEMAGRLKRAEGTLKALAGQQGSAGSTGDSGASTIGERLARRQRSVTAKYQEAVAGSESLKEAEAARLDSLESDNFTKPELPVDDDDEEFMLDEDEEEGLFHI